MTTMSLLPPVICVFALLYLFVCAREHSSRILLKEQAYNAVLSLGDEAAYGRTILRALNYKPALGALYTVLEELVDEGRLERRLDTTYRPERGGAPRAYYAVVRRNDHK